MQWFKFYGGEYLSDPKMLALNASERSCWITLLSYASVADDGGRVKHLTEESLLSQSNVNVFSEEWRKDTSVIKKFEELGMITVDSNGTVTICNWGKRQESYLTGAERQKRFRDKQKSNNKVTRKSNESNARIEENRIEENRIDNATPAPRKRSAKKKIVVQFTSEGAEIIKAFEEIDPKNKNYYANKTQRGACDFLLAEYGMEKVLNAIKILPQINRKKLYIKQITTPYELQENWVKIGNALKQETSTPKVKII